MNDEDDSEEKRKKYRIILSGLAIHFLLLLAVFDIYFASPVDHGMSPIRSTNSPPAKRVVLFVADGLRAQAIFGEDNENLTPFLTNTLKNVGSWGVAHTRVPTESRPGHVALLAGLYEDPSAILKGWKSNPVNFDSVINQSTNAWCWGSPDIVTIFNRDNLSKIHTSTYDSQIEDFGKHDTGLLDTWVFEKVKEFLQNDVSKCTENCDTYFMNGNIFFLHLLGIDTAGHGYKPHSIEYKNNIRLVDENVKIISEMFRSIYNDELTAFVFTADHGMTNWGSHGAGTEHETQVPLIAWGAGIQKNNKQQDVNQVDLAPLLASLIGINIPINSLGVLPINYINTTRSNLAHMLISNVLQLLEIFNKKRLRTEKNSLIFVPFKNITTNLLNEKISNFKKISNTDYLITECKQFIEFILEGVNYYHNYYQIPVLITITLGFIMWIIFLWLSVFGIPNKQFSSKRDNLIMLICILTTTFLCVASEFNLSYYLYFNFPILTYFKLLKNRQIKKCSINISRQFILQSIYYLIGLELLVYGFYNRIAFTVVMMLVGNCVNVYESLKRNSSNVEKVIWIFCSLVLAIFPSLPVMKTSFNLPMFLVGYVGYVFLFTKVYFYDLTYYQQLRNLKLHKYTFLLQFFFLQMATMYMLLLEFNYISADSIYKYLSWVISGMPVLVIPLTDRFILLRLTATLFGFAPFYVLVSPNYELLFSVFYIFLLYRWLLLESKTFKYESSHKLVYFLRFEKYKNKTNIRADDFRRAFLFMVFIFIGFFGTGNIASMNSFDPMWVRAFLTVFSPFKMAGLILLKFMVPFIFTCSIFRAINEVGKQNILNIFCIILFFSDLMVVQFLYLITNVGSWLDIGTSLSHFIIMEGFVTILLLLYGVAYWLTSIRY